MHEDPERISGGAGRSCVPYTSEQFATKQVMERHENVTQGVTNKQERQAARSSTDGYLREASRLTKHDRDGRLDDPSDKK